MLGRSIEDLRTANEGYESRAREVAIVSDGESKSLVDVLVPRHARHRIACAAYGVNMGKAIPVVNKYCH